MREVSQFSIDVDEVTDAASAGVNSLGDDIVSGGGDPLYTPCLLYTSPSPRDLSTSRMPSSA